MTTIEIARPSRAAADAYDSLAEAYDVMTTGYCHEVWLERIEELASEYGLRGHRLLDLACGTGKSFLPLAERGYQVTACDVSPRMVEIARAKAPAARILCADVRELAHLGQFDLITCLDDAVNYLLSSDEIEAFFAGIARNLAPTGVAVFDVNSVKLYREGFARDWLIDDPDAFIAWAGRDAKLACSGDRVAATVHVFTPEGPSWSRRVSRHEQRHWPQPELAEAASEAGLRIAAVRGQRRGAVLDRRFDELEHDKALYVVVHEEGR